MTYFVVNIKINNPDWIENYTTNVPSILKKYGGEYVLNSTKIEVLEGTSDLTDFISIVKFPSKQSALSFRNDKDYVPLLEQRIKGTEAITYLIEEEK